MTRATIVIKRNRKGELTGYRHVGQWAKWYNPAPECWGIGHAYGWGTDNFRGRYTRPYYASEFELGERVAVALGARPNGQVTA